MKSTLWQISVSIPEEAEEFIGIAFENTFGRTPSIYTNANTRKTTASIFLNRSSHWNPDVKRELQKNISHFREAGLEIGPGKIVAKKLPRENWAESWKKHFKPIEIGDALLIKPSWSRKSPKKNQALVVLDPGLSFGTGQHATTLFCLQQLVNCRKKNSAQSFFDIGTGSGILAISAAKLGYSPVEAFDFDPEAVHVSRTNAIVNSVEKRVAPRREDLTKLSVNSKKKHDVICANLIYDVLLNERKKIVNRLSLDGSLMLAGILKTQFSEVKGAFEGLGLKLVESVVGKEWRSGRFIFSVKN